jgi:hypothetical protein
MGNLFKAHIFRDRKVGNREEVTLKLFNKDGTPLDLNGGSEAPTGAMIFRGNWISAQPYDAGDVVLYNDGTGVKTYIFTSATGTVVDFPLDKAIQLGVGETISAG